MVFILWSDVGNMVKFWVQMSFQNTQWQIFGYVFSMESWHSSCHTTDSSLYNYAPAKISLRHTKNRLIYIKLHLHNSPKCVVQISINI